MTEEWEQGLHAKMAFEDSAAQYWQYMDMSLRESSELETALTLWKLKRYCGTGRHEIPLQLHASVVQGRAHLNEQKNR